MCANSAEIAAVDRREAAEERVDQRLHLARELLEHEVLILHLGDEPRRLEQPFAVIPAGSGITACHAAISAGVSSALIMLVDVVHEPVVLGVEDLVHRRQRDVLVATAVAGDEVQAEQLVVVGAGGLAVDAR